MSWYISGLPSVAPAMNPDIVLCMSQELIQSWGQRSRCTSSLSALLENHHRHQPMYECAGWLQLYWSGDDVNEMITTIRCAWFWNNSHQTVSLPVYQDKTTSQDSPRYLPIPASAWLINWIPFSSRMYYGLLRFKYYYDRAALNLSAPEKQVLFIWWCQEITSCGWINFWTSYFSDNVWGLKLTWTNKNRILKQWGEDLGLGRDRKS